MQLTDIDGKVHKLSEYKGKDVLVVFWATWCPPCNMEVPGLIKLRKTNSADKLQILAISSEQGGIETVREFVDKKEINYTTIWTRHNELPAPFVHTTDLPTAFFIDKQGNFKLITAGMMDEESVQGIIDAK
jgi:thiol-disulfide isomerase/thioredoxin